MNEEVNTKLVVNTDVSLVDINSIPDIGVEETPVDNAEVVIYRASERGACFTLDRAGVMLVEQFRNGSTIAEALSQVASQLNVAKDAFAKSAHPLLEKLIRDRFVVEESHLEEGRPGLPSKADNQDDVLHGQRVIQKVSQYEDRVVFKVALALGGYGALKALRVDSEEGACRLRREYAILTRLNGTIAPRVLDARLEGRELYILTEWIDGINVVDWSSGLENFPHERRYGELRRLSLHIVSAFEELHRHNIVHSDIRPNTILVDRFGRIRILNFGLSRWSLTDEQLGLPAREKADVYTAPDFAMAELEGKMPPPASVASDIYSLGVTLYRLIVGNQYLDFPLEVAEHNRMICDGEICSFDSRGAHSWAEMEQLLAEMLDKDPEKRIGSLADCMERLQVMPLPSMQTTPSNTITEMDPIPFIRSYLGETLEVPFVPPAASLFLGLGGLAYAFFRAAVLFQERTLLVNAELLVRKAREWMSNEAEGSFTAPTFVTKGDVGENTLFHHDEGLVMLQALVAHALCDKANLRASCLRLMRWDVTRKHPAGYMSGSVGILNAIRQLSYLVVENRELISFGMEIAESVLTELEEDGEIGRSRTKCLGFAHGWAGILHTLLSWSRSYRPQFVARIVPFLEQLSEMKIATGRGSYWPRLSADAGGDDDSASWHDGTGGQILLWTEAYKATGDKQWLVNATEAGNHLAKTAMRNVDLYCGAAGRALCLGHLYAVTEDEKWWKLAKNMLRQPRLVQDTYIHSLFRGIPGLEVARAELRRPDLLVFPTIASNQYGPPLSVGSLSRLASL